MATQKKQPKRAPKKPTKAPKQVNATPVAHLVAKSLKGDDSALQELRDRAAAEKPKAAPGRKAPKLALVPVDAARNEDALAAAEDGKAPKAQAHTIRGSYLAYLSTLAGEEYSPHYVDGLVRSVGEFVGMVEALGYQKLGKLDTAALLAYRKRVQHTPGGHPRAVATQRKELGRVRSFLLWLDADKRPRLGDEDVQGILTIKAVAS